MASPFRDWKSRRNTLLYHQARAIIASNGCQYCTPFIKRLVMARPRYLNGIAHLAVTGVMLVFGALASSAKSRKINHNENYYVTRRKPTRQRFHHQLFTNEEVNGNDVFIVITENIEPHIIYSRRMPIIVMPNSWRLIPSCQTAVYQADFWSRRKWRHAYLSEDDDGITVRRHQPEHEDDLLNIFHFSALLAHIEPNLMKCHLINFIISTRCDIGSEHGFTDEAMLIGDVNALSL